VNPFPHFKRCPPAIVERCLASVAFAHRTAGLRSPADDRTGRAVSAGIRGLGTDGETRAAPITIPLARRMIV
jgi:hypothetical protein